MIEDRRERYPTPRTLQRVRRPVPVSSQNTRMLVVGGLIGVLLLVLVVAMSQRSPARKAGTGGGANAQQARVSDAPPPAAKPAAPVIQPVALPATETVSPVTPKSPPKEISAPAPAKAKTAPVTRPAIAAEKAKKEPAAEIPTEEPVEDVLSRPRDLFPSAGISSLAKFVPGPEGQEGKADEIVRVAVESLKITRNNKGKTGYSLVLSKVKILKGRTFGEEATQTLNLGAIDGDPMKEFGLDPATATGKTMVLFLKNDAADGSFSFFGLTDEDYERLKSKVTAAAR